MNAKTFLLIVYLLLSVTGWSQNNVRIDGQIIGYDGSKEVEQTRLAVPNRLAHSPSTLLACKEHKTGNPGKTFAKEKVKVMR